MDNTVQVQISAIDNSKEAFNSLARNLDTVEKATQSTQERIEALQPAFEKMAVAGTAVFAGIVAGAKSSVNAYAEVERGQRQLSNAIINVSKGTQEQVDTINELTSALEEKAGIDADSLTMGVAQLSTFGLQTDSVVALTKSLADFTVNQNGLNASSDQYITSANTIAKALNGQFGILEKSGIRFTQAQQDLINFGTESEKVSALQEGLAQNLRETTDTVNGIDVANAKASRGFENMSENLGKALAPAFTELASKVTPVIDKLATWAENNPQLVANIVLIAGGIAGLVAVVGTLGLLLPPIIAGFGLLATAVGAISLPMIAIGAVIAGVGFALYTLYQNWDTVLAFVQTKSTEVWTAVTGVFTTAVQAISTAVSSVWESIKTVFANSLNFLVGVVAVFLDYLVPNWDVALVAIYNKLSEILVAMRDYLAGKLQELATVFSEWATFFGTIWAEVWESIKATFTTVWDGIKAIFDGVISGIKSGLDTLTAPIEKVIKLAERAISLAKEVGGNVASKAKDTISNILSRGSGITGVGGKALGGGVTANTPYIVGERGRELFIPNTSGQIVPNNKLGVGAQAPASNITINISGTFMDDRASARRLANEVMSVLSKNQRIPA